MEHVMNLTMLDSFCAILVSDEKSQSTINKYLRDLEIFSRFAAGNVITKELVISYKQHLVEATLEKGKQVQADAFVKFCIGLTLCDLCWCYAL